VANKAQCCIGTNRVHVKHILECEAVYTPELLKIQVRGVEWGIAVRRQYRLGDLQTVKRSVRAVATAGDEMECRRSKEKCSCMLGLTCLGRSELEKWANAC
jgi:hypothetical protein